MLYDAATPAPSAGWCSRSPASAEELAYRAARWDGATAAALIERLRERGAKALSEVGRERLSIAWIETVERFRDPASTERRALDPALAATTRLSPEGLSAGLEAVLGGVSGRAAAGLFADAWPAAEATPVLVVLAANLPALAVQPLLPALAVGRPAIIKSASAEPLFTPAFATALARREPLLSEAVAALTWTGGDREIETPLLEGAGAVIAYGEQGSLDDLERRTKGRFVGYGPKTSLAVVGRGALGSADAVERVAASVARDVALFDQRGCLSIQAIYTDGEPEPLARALAAALGREAERLPPGPSDFESLAGLRQLLADAELRDLAVFATGSGDDRSLAHGTVVVDPQPAFRPSPGLRAARLHPLDSLAELPPILEPWRGRLQGAALAGLDVDDPDHRRLLAALEAVGISRVAQPGELQSPDARWHNGGVDPLAVLR